MYIVRNTISSCLSILLLVTTSLVGTGKVCAQEPLQLEDWQNVRVTVRVSSQPLGNVLHMVADKAGARIVYQDVTLVGIDKLITLNVEAKPLHEIIYQLIKDQNVKIRYEVNRTIVISSSEQKSDLIPIEGIVMAGDTKEPLFGATVMILDGAKSGVKEGTVTDEEGKFNLMLPYKASIKVTFVGFESYVLQILKSSRQMKILLEPNATNIGEVVVTGLSKRSSTSFTGNYVSVKGEELRKINPNNFLKGLQFFDPSFKVVENNNRGADPNAQPEFQLRGDQSLGNVGTMNTMDLMLDNVSTRPNTPLFVLDGFIVPMSRVLSLDPQQIENVTILKDAAATAIYGSKASNGVIVIETIVSPDGALSVSYNGGLTVQIPDLTDYVLMDAAEKLETERLAGVYPEENLILMNRYNVLKRNVLVGVNTYWLSQPLRTALQNRHTLTAMGGTEVFRYTLGLNAIFSPGIMEGSSRNTSSVNFNMTYRKDKVMVGANINLSENAGKQTPYGSFSIFTRTNPYYPISDKPILDQYIGVGSTPIINPLYDGSVGVKDFTRSLNIATNLNFEYRMLQNLRLTEQLSYSRGIAGSERFLPASHSQFETQPDLTLRGSYNKSNGEMTSWSSNMGVNYNLPHDVHLLSVFGNWIINEDRSNYVNLSANGYPDVHMDDFIFGTKMVNDPSGTEALSRSMSLIGQLSYSYDNRYSADFNVSAEVSSRYADHRLSPFWSAGLRWNAYREKWLEGRVSNLVFRATYGITGEQGSDPYQTIEFYTFSDTMKPYTSFNTLGATLRGLNNADLKWARTGNLSLGVDMGFWNNRVNASLNFYNNITHQLLVQYDLQPSTGYNSQYINAGELQNLGLDASLNVIAYQSIKERIYWILSVNGNHNKNTIRQLSDFLREINAKQLANKGNPLPILQEGGSTTTLHMVRSLGVDPITGDEVFLTREGKKTFKWDPVDKVPVGDIRPKISGTFSSSLNWGNLSWLLGFTYKWGGVVYNQTLVDKIENRGIAFNMDRRAMTDRWKTPGDLTWYKRLSTKGAQTPQSTRFLMKDNEVKLSSLTLGYSLYDDQIPLLRKLFAKRINLSFTTNDLIRFSSVKMERGLDYPFSRSYTFTCSFLFR